MDGQSFASLGSHTHRLEREFEMQENDTPVQATGIKETMDVLETVKVSLVELKDALADGSIDLADLPKLWPVIASAKDAVIGLSEVPVELMDLDQNEIKTVVGKIAEILALVVDLVLKTAKK